MKMELTSGFLPFLSPPHPLQACSTSPHPLFFPGHSPPRAGFRIPEILLSSAVAATILRILTMKGLLLLALSTLVCWVSADIHCHSCYKIPLMGCVDRQSCHLEPNQQCMTTKVYLGKMWLFSNLRCGTPQEPCRAAFNQTNHKLGLTYNTTCCSTDNCNNPAPRPTPALALIFLTSLAGLGLWLLH
ncbi:lymphocyte antigen 6 complex locus protein G6c isoform 1-T2 [Dugong dugon]